MAKRPKISAAMMMVSEYCGTTNGTTHAASATRPKRARQSIYSSLPSRPPGRAISTASIRRYMNASASSWK